jgi:protocadherin Fat 4
MIHASSQATKKKRRKCGGESGNTMTIGLTAEEIERLNNSRHKNNSSLISTLDAVSSSESDDRRKNNLSNLLESKPDRRTRSRNTSSEEDESGNDSFSCSEFEYDNDKRDFRQPHSHMMFSKMAPDGAPEGEESFRGSLSTLVASDDDLSYINSYAKAPNHLPGGPSSIGWDYLLNWGPNFDNLAGVFKDIAQLPDNTHPPHSHNIPSSSNHPTNVNLGNSSSGSANRNSRYPTPRPSEEYV